MSRKTGTGQEASRDWSYTWSDASPPGVSLKRLDLQNVVPDCTAAPEGVRGR